MALGSGLCAAAAFEPIGWAPLLLPAVAGLSLAVHGRRGRSVFGAGFLFGLGFMGALLPWLQVIGVDAWIGLTILEAAFYGLLAVLIGRVARLPLWPVWAAACWVLIESLRSVLPWGGFPWGRLSFGVIDTPLAHALAVIGTSGTTFLIALLGNVLAWLVLNARSCPRRAGVATVLTLAVVALAAVFPISSTDTKPVTVRVAAVQGNVPGEGMDAFSERRAVLNNHVNATLELADRIARGETRRPDFVLWPENSTDIDPYTDPTVYADIQGAVDAVGVPTLVGAMVTGPEPVEVRNEGIVWNPGTGPADYYAKTHPVPFGEYIPMRAQLAKVFERLDQIPRDMVPGTEPGVLDLAGTTIGDVICFEVAWDGLVDDVVKGGARLLVVQTNNATYMGTGQVEQQFAIARLRAVQTSRYVVVVATNGVSGIIGPDGEIIERAATRETVVMEDDLPLRTDITPGVHWGRSIELVLLVVAGAALLIAVLLDRRRRRAGRAEPEATGESHGRQ